MEDCRDVVTVQDAVPSAPEKFVILGGPTSDSLRKLDLWQHHPDNALLWDVLLEPDDGPAVPANRLDLAAVSDYFLTLFTGVFADARSRLLRLPGICRATLLSLVETVYSRELWLDLECVEDVLEVSDRLQMAAAKDACCAFLEHHCGSSVASVLALSSRFSAPELRTNAVQHVVRHFSRIMADDEQAARVLGSLTHAELASVLSSDELFISSEKTVFRAVQLWAAVQGGGGVVPRGVLAGLVEAVRVEHMSAAEVQRLMRDEARAGTLGSLIAQVALQWADPERRPWHERRSRTSASVFTWVVDDWAAQGMHTCLWSDPFKLAGSAREWRLLAYPFGNSCSYLSLYLCPAAAPDGEPPAREEKLDFKLHVVNQAAPSFDTATKQAIHVFGAHERAGHGFQRMLPLSELHDPAHGFLIDNRVVLQASVPAVDGSEVENRLYSLKKALLRDHLCSGELY